MNRIQCQLTKRPTLFLSVGAAFVIAMTWLIVLFAISFFEEQSGATPPVLSLLNEKAALRLNGAITGLFAVMFLAAPILLRFSKFSIVVQRSKTTFLVSRQLFVFNFKIYARRFRDIADVYWKKHSDAESDGATFHLYGRQAPNGNENESRRDVTLSGGFWHAITLVRSDVEFMRQAFCKLRDAG